MDQAAANDDDDANDDEDIINDEIEDDDDNLLIDEVANEPGASSTDVDDSILDGSSRQILYGQIDPIEWKTELERVGQKLKAQQVVSTNEWRAHVDQTITSKDSIDKILVDTKGGLGALNQ